MDETGVKLRTEHSKRQVKRNLVTWHKLMFAVCRKRDFKSLLSGY